MFFFLLFTSTCTYSHLCHFIFSASNWWKSLYISSMIFVPQLAQDWFTHFILGFLFVSHIVLATICLFDEITCTFWSSLWLHLNLCRSSVLRASLEHFSHKQLLQFVSLATVTCRGLSFLNDINPIFTSGLVVTNTLCASCEDISMLCLGNIVTFSFFFILRAAFLLGFSLLIPELSKSFSLFPSHAHLFYPSWAFCFYSTKYFQFLSSGNLVFLVLSFCISLVEFFCFLHCLSQTWVSILFILFHVYCFRFKFLKLSPIDSNRALPICRVLWVLSEIIAPFLSRIFLVDGDCMSFSTIFSLFFGVLGRLHLAFRKALFSVEVDGNIFSDSLAFCKGSFNLRCHDFIFKHACFFSCALSLSANLCSLSFNLFSLFLAAIFLEFAVLVCSGCKFFYFSFFLISCIWSFCFSLAFCASLGFFAGILSFSFLPLLS